MTRETISVEKQKFILSPSEIRFFFQEHVYPTLGIFNEKMGFIINALLCEETLYKALQIVVRRHEVLRASTIIEDDEPKLFINHTIKLKIRKFNITTEADSITNECIINEVRESFDLYNAPLFRLTYFIINNKQSLLTLTMHHMVSDGDPSFTIFFKELICFYNYFSDKTIGKPPNLPLPIARCDLIKIFQKIYLQDNMQQRLLFWKVYLQNAVMEIKLKRTPMEETEAKFYAKMVRRQFSIPKSYLSNGYQIYDNRSFFTAITAVVLAKYSNQSDIIFGIPYHSRDNICGLDLDYTIGYYGNVVPLRIKVDAHKSLMDLLSDVTKGYSIIQAYADLPFQAIVQSVAPNWRSLYKSPLFNVLFIFAYYLPSLSIHINGEYIHAYGIDLSSGVLAYDLVITIRFNEKDSKGEAIIEYNTEFSTSEIIHNLLEDICSMINQYYPLHWIV